MSDELVPTGARTDVVGTVHAVDGELVVRMRPSGVRDVTGRPVRPQVPTRQLGCLTYVGPLTGAARAEHLADLARWERRRQRRQRWRGWLRWTPTRREVTR